MPLLTGAEEPLNFDYWNITEPTAKTAPSFAQSTNANPATYPMLEALHQRREQVIRALAREDLSKWRKGFFPRRRPRQVPTRCGHGQAAGRPRRWDGRELHERQTQPA